MAIERHQSNTTWRSSFNCLIAHHHRLALIKNKNSGFTLIEVLASISTVAVLIALIIPAVLSAREASRKASCSSNLRQIGIALSNYSASFGVFPGATNGSGYSFLTSILPHLESGSLYHHLNFNIPVSMSTIGSANGTVMRTAINSFLCPSDALALSNNETGATNYAGNRGVDDRTFLDNGFFALYSPPRTTASVIDGLSFTASVTEWIRGPLNEGSRDTRGSIFNVLGELSGIRNFVNFNRECSAIDFRAAPIASNDKGMIWTFGGYGRTLYNHNNVINGNSCTNHGFVQEGAYTSSSRHWNGSHVLFGDGHVHFTMNSISPTTWRAIGTINKGEVVTLGVD